MTSYRLGMANGLIYLSTPTATVGLVVRDGVVVDAPPYARRWALGADARELWRRYASRPENHLEWIEERDDELETA